ncbi:hypothetical protein Tco_1318478 [Tanacetum coccineum]
MTGDLAFCFLHTRPTYPARQNLSLEGALVFGPVPNQLDCGLILLSQSFWPTAQSMILVDPVTHGGHDDAYPTADAVGGTEDPALLTSLSAQIDRTARLVGDAPATEGDVDIQDAVDLEGLSRMASEALGHDHATLKFVSMRLCYDVASRSLFSPSYCRDVVVAGSVIQTIQDGLRESYECLASAPM